MKTGGFSDSTEVIYSRSDQDYDSEDEKTQQQTRGDVFMSSSVNYLNQTRSDCGKPNQDCVDEIYVVHMEFK